MDEQPPQRKKVRSKYAPKACVSCRRSKLKCSGANPCQRCTENGKRCFYTEDQTAAEALQNLSRPAPSQPPPPLATSLAAQAHAQAANGNGALARRNILPRHEAIERRASDASLLGLSMEARMARIEGMMETLIQERATTATPRMSTERDEAVGDVVQPDLNITGEPFFPNFVQQRHQSFHLDSPERPRLSASMASPPSPSQSPISIRVGSKTFAFPPPLSHQKAIDFFFADLSAYYPCVNEADFRLKSDRMLATPSLPPTDACFLALSYIIFACVDMALDTTVSQAEAKPAGWAWFQAADDLVGSKAIVGQGHLTMMQYLILKAVYLTIADEPDAAYNTIGIACRLCFQLGINQQSSWRNHTPFELHMQQRIFWTAFTLDRQISLSCGRPYCIRDSDVDTEQPAYLCDKDVHPDRPLPDMNTAGSSMPYLRYMINWSQFAAQVWNGHFCASIMAMGTPSEDNARGYSERIASWSEDIPRVFPLLPSDSGVDRLPELRQHRQHTLAHIRVAQLRLLLYRQNMLSLRYSADCGSQCGDLAIDITQRVRHHTAEPNHPSSFRFAMATALGHALLILTTLLIRDLSAVGLEDAWKGYVDAYAENFALLQELSTHLAIAGRILNDFGNITALVQTIIAERERNPDFPHYLVPANIHELLPYTSVDFAQQSNAGALVIDRNLADVDVAMIRDMAPFNFEVGAREGRYGVLWI